MLFVEEILQNDEYEWADTANRYLEVWPFHVREQRAKRICLHIHLATAVTTTVMEDN